MKFSDDELTALHGLVYDKAYYGDDYIVYGDGPEAFMIRNLVAKLTDEMDRRARK